MNSILLAAEMGGQRLFRCGQDRNRYCTQFSEIEPDVVGNCIVIKRAMKVVGTILENLAFRFRQPGGQITGDAPCRIGVGRRKADAVRVKVSAIAGKL